MVKKTRIKSGDTVIVISGKDKGKIGKVLSIYKQQGKLMVEGVNIVKVHKKSPNPENKQPNIVDKQMPLSISNVMHYNLKEKKRERIQYATQDGKKIRISVLTKEKLGS